jgi:hypothetical protein
MSGEKKNENISIPYKRFTPHAINRCTEMAEGELFIPQIYHVKDLLENKIRPDKIDLMKCKFHTDMGYILFRPDVSVKIDTLAFLNYSTESISELIIDQYGDEAYSPTVIDDYLYFFFNLRYKGLWNPWIARRIYDYITHSKQLSDHYSILVNILSKNLDEDEALLTIGFKTHNTSQIDVLHSYQLVVKTLKRAIA